ncbi:MAG: DUF4236 domain-containing protein [Erysipelotrichaceae bacterium]|nr:DUF4236 domain-containing protein [Erysipelotrichaceae bacterium]
MGIRFAKSIKIGNYLRINFTKNGVSATIGKRGASVNVGTKGAYLNLSPAAVGVNGTGLSYRQKILSLGSSKKKKKTTSAAKKKTYVAASEAKKTSSLKKEEIEAREEQLLETVNEEVSEETVDPVQDYENNHEAIVNLHKYAAPVMNKEEFEKYAASLESEAKKELFKYALEGDEDIIENMVSSFMSSLELAYDVRVNYELEDDILYVDLDLPEIEELSRDYPAYNNGKLVRKRKTSSQMKEEYARLVLSLGIFLSASYFNISSYITRVVMSGFTSLRDRNGDLIDQYLYSIRFVREVFEKTDLSQVEDPYRFILQFENRINMSDAYNFKAVKPYEMESALQSNELIEDAIAALKELGYKAAELAPVKKRLAEYRYENPSDYLKEGLRILKEEK